MKKTLLISILCLLSTFLFSNEFKSIPLPEKFADDQRYTVMTWAYIPSELGPMKASGFGVKGYCFASRGSMNGGVQFYLGITSGIPEFKFVPKDRKSWAGLRKEETEKKAMPELAADNWFHIAGVRDGDVMKLYLNGQLVATAGNLPEAPQFECPALLGALEVNHVYYDNRFPGYLEKYAFEARALSDKEIKEIVDRQEFQLPLQMPAIRPYEKPDFEIKLPIVRKYESKLGKIKSPEGKCVARVVMEAGRPRVELNGKIVDATLALPAVIKSNEQKKLCLRDFAAAGVKFYMDVWYTTTKLNDWWLGEGKYDFVAFDKHMQALLDACPDGYVIPRFKLDPPEWWRSENPDEMLVGYVNPASEKWHALFETMLRDVVGHIENSGYSGRIAGYNYGAMVGSEWISRRNDVPKGYDPGYWQQRADAVSVPLLKASRVIKEVTGGNKLTGVFFGYPLAEHANLMKVVESPDVDFFCSPIRYDGRRAGEPGRFSSPYQATYRLHGKLYWSEADERTHLSEFPGTWHPAWHQIDEFETEQAMLRDLGWALTSGHEIWWFTIAGNECFHDEKIMQTVKKGVEMANNRPAKGRVSEIAVFTPVWYAPDPAEGRIKELKSAFLNFVVSSCGVPVDSYELSDLANPNLPKYKAAIVLTDTHGIFPQPVDKDMKLIVYKNENELPVDAAQFRKICEDAGAHVWNRDGDTFAAGCGYVFIHAASEGDKTICFPDGKVWNGHLRLGETKILTY